MIVPPKSYTGRAVVRGGKGARKQHHEKYIYGTQGMRPLGTHRAPFEGAPRVKHWRSERLIDGEMYVHVCVLVDI